MVDRRRSIAKAETIRPEVHARFLEAMKRAVKQEARGFEALRPSASRVKSKTELSRERGWRKSNALVVSRRQRRAS